MKKMFKKNSIKKWQIFMMSTVVMFLTSFIILPQTAYAAAPPGKLTDVKAMATAIGEVTITWGSPTVLGGGQLKSYVLKSADDTNYATVNPYTFSYVYTGLKDNTVYNFGVAANGAGIGEFTFVSVKTLSATDSTPNTYTVKVVNGSGSGIYKKGDTVTITAIKPTDSYTFNKWETSDGVTLADASKPTTTFTITDKNVTVTAFYTQAPPDYSSITITEVANGVGMSNVNLAKLGEIVLLSYKANKGYKFKNWELISGGVKIEDDSFSMFHYPVEITPIFEKVPTYKVKVNEGTSADDIYIAGETVTINANKASSGKAFDKWETSDGVKIANVNLMSTTFVMPAKDVTVTATYKSIPVTEFSIDVYNDGGGTANPNVTSAKPGQEIKLTPKPNEGFLFGKYVVVAGTLEIVDNKFIMPAETVIIEARFEPLKVYIINVVNGTSNKTSSTVGGIITISADIAPDGKAFDKWVTSSGVYIEEITSMNTIFYMPSKTVVVEAKYKDLPEGEKAVSIKTGTDGGSVTVDSSAKPGDTVKLTPEAKPGYEFVGYYVADGTVDIKNNKFVMPNKNVDIEAMFKPIYGDLYGLNDFLMQWWWLLLATFIVSIPIGYSFRKYIIGRNDSKQIKGGELA